MVFTFLDRYENGQRRNKVDLILQFGQGERDNKERVISSRSWTDKIFLNGSAKTSEMCEKRQMMVTDH
jgi:hypothetical protein